MRRLSAPLFVLIVLFNSTDASAGACDAGESGFDDVPDAAIFCKEALWLRNALVTLGCVGNTGSTRVHVPANRWTNMTHLGGPGTMGGLGAQLSPAHSYQFRLRLTRQGGSTGDVIETQCSLRLDLPVDPIL